MLGRATQGVRLIELRKKDQIAAVAKVDGDLQEDEPETEEGAEGGDAPENGTEVAGEDEA